MNKEDVLNLEISDIYKFFTDLLTFNKITDFSVFDHHGEINWIRSFLKRTGINFKLVLTERYHNVNFKIYQTILVAGEEVTSKLPVINKTFANIYPERDNFGSYYLELLNNLCLIVKNFIETFALVFGSIEGSKFKEYGLELNRFLVDKSKIDTDGNYHNTRLAYLRDDGRVTYFDIETVFKRETSEPVRTVLGLVYCNPVLSIYMPSVDEVLSSISEYKDSDDQYHDIEGIYEDDFELRKNVPNQIVFDLVKTIKQ